jgi:hypothetical protein
MNNQCQFCIFASQSNHPDVQLISCRFNPPIVNTVNGDNRKWPLVRPDDWCGKFQGADVVKSVDGGRLEACKLVRTLMNTQSSGSGWMHEFERLAQLDKES